MYASIRDWSSLSTVRYALSLKRLLSLPDRTSECLWEHSCCLSSACIKGVLCTAKKKRGGGRKRAVSPQCEVRLKMATADFAIMRLMAQPHCKICVFSNMAPKISENAENAQKKERPEIAWFTVTMRRAPGRPDVGAGRIRATDRPKNFNRFESHTQHLSNEDKSGRLQPDLQEFSR